MKNINILYYRGAILLLALLLKASAFGQTTWNPTTEFSTTTNPNGVWTYGAWNNAFTEFGAFNLFTTGSHPRWSTDIDFPPNVYFNGSAEPVNLVPPGYLALHPGPNYTDPQDSGPAVVRWTAPAGFTGNLDINGEFLAGDVGVMSLAVRKGGTVLWSGTDSGTFDLTSVYVVPGDYIDFTVYNGWSGGSTPLDVTITGYSAIPEPSTYVAAIGLLALIAAAVRRSASRRNNSGEASLPGAV